MFELGVYFGARGVAKNVILAWCGSLKSYFKREFTVFVFVCMGFVCLCVWGLCVCVHGSLGTPGLPGAPWGNV